MAGAQDLVILRIPLDVALSNAQFPIGANQIVVGRMDSPFTIRFETLSGPVGEIVRPMELADCADQIERIYITAPAVAGGVIELWLSKDTSVEFP